MYKILDCTLRDGGYINNWEFGENEIKTYLNLILKNSVDFVEVGFLTDDTANKNQTLFNSIKDINNYTNYSKKLTLMLAFGKYDTKNLPERDSKTIENIRFIFKPEQSSIAFEEAKIIKQKGYNLFINPTFVSQYTTDEILNLIDKTNKITPKCFTLVDSMGVLDGIKFFELVDTINKNLDSKIDIGIHLHNNLNLVRENISILKKMKLNRNILIDATIKGIGRGGGNVVLEDLIYVDEKIITLIKPVIEKFFKTDKTPYKLAALNFCHPCYASYMIKNKIHKDRMESVFQTIPKDFRTNFNREIIKNLVDNLK